jgi:apolipoprotein D and lipocalin family protein
MTRSPLPVRSARRSPLARAAGLIVPLLFLAGATVLARLPASTQPRAVPQLDLDRYSGTWYELARLPNRFQAQCAGEVTATYLPRPDGRLDVVNRCRRADGTLDEARGVARVASRAETDAKLQVRFAPAVLSVLPWVWADYWVLHVAEDYSTAVVGTPDGRHLWLLSRTPSVEERAYQALVTRAAAQGYAVDGLVRTRQGG